MKKSEQYKRLFRLGFVAILFLAEMFIFHYVWRTYYSNLMEITYANLGHWMIVGVYGLMLCIFTVLFAGWKIGYLRIFNTVYLQSIATLGANVIIYLQIVLLTKHFYSIVPIIAMSAIDIAIIAIWSPVASLLYRVVYPPRKVLMVFAERWSEGILEKFNSRADCFHVEEKINVTEGLETIYKKCHLYEAVIICDVPSETRNKILKYCYDNSIRTYTTPKISDVIMRSSEEIHLFDTPLLLSRNVGLTAEQRFMKRFFDIVLSVIALLIFWPFMAIIALAIKIDDGGPVFFKQDRVTMNGKVFSILKFRSMIVDAEKNGAVIPAIDNDPRITKVGKIIRKIRVDELPQILNILKGEMSIVGPRPERVEHVEKYKKDIPEFKYREKVKAGLTGIAQVYGKYNTSAYDKLKLDLMYIQNYKVLLDIELIIQTVKILFEKESTEGFDKSTAKSEENTKTEENK